jgi:hypothetical protein
MTLSGFINYRFSELAQRLLWYRARRKDAFSGGRAGAKTKNPVSLHNNNGFAHGSILKKQMSK